MSLATVRTALVALLRAVPNVGVVHDYQRYVREEDKFRQLYVYSGAGIDPHVRGWQLSNTDIQERSLGMGRVLNGFTWAIRGYLSLKDDTATELQFDALCEAIRAAYRANPTLGGVCTAESLDGGPDGIQKLGAGPVLFCGVLCHSALLQLTTWEHPT